MTTLNYFKAGWISEKKLIVIAVLFMVVITVNGCGSSSSNSVEEPYGGPVIIEITSAPSVIWNSLTGKTTVVVQFIARDESGLPLEDSKINVGMEVDSKEIDNESLLEEASKELEVNLLYSMVLDASYSMTQHKPPAFEPMKQSAKSSLDEVQNLWSSRPGKVDFSLLWFDDFLQRSIGQWSSSNILLIPTPKAGAATKLYAAVDSMASDMAQLYQSGVAAGSRDRHIMILLSDGVDNVSYHDNSEIEEILSLQGGVQYRKMGWPARTLDDALNRIKAHPKLTVHVIGLGSDVNDTELTEIANAGGGIYLKNPSTTEVNSIFSRVTKEFTTLQTRGAAIPLRTGDYTFTLIINNKQNTESDNYMFDFHAGDVNARMIP